MFFFNLIFPHIRSAALRRRGGPPFVAACAVSNALVVFFDSSFVLRCFLFITRFRLRAIHLPPSLRLEEGDFLLDGVKEGFEIHFYHMDRLNRCVIYCLNSL